MARLGPSVGHGTAGHGAGSPWVAGLLGTLCLAVSLSRSLHVQGSVRFSSPTRSSSKLGCKSSERHSRRGTPREPEAGSVGEAPAASAETWAPAQGCEASQGRAGPSIGSFICWDRREELFASLDSRGRAPDSTVAGACDEPTGHACGSACAPRGRRYRRNVSTALPPGTTRQVGATPGGRAHRLLDSDRLLSGRPGPVPSLRPGTHTWKRVGFLFRQSVSTSPKSDTAPLSGCGPGVPGKGSLLGNREAAEPAAPRSCSVTHSNCCLTDDVSRQGTLCSLRGKHTRFL